jgi:hypothetical protein
MTGWMCSCQVGKKPSAVVAEPAVPPSIPGAIPPRMNPASASAGAPASSVRAPVQLTAEEDILFTDPDNPDAKIPELMTLLEANPQRRKGPWEDSESRARKRSMREGKPLLIWFTDSRSSPMCKALAQELFNDPAFNKWAEEHLIRLKVDSYARVTDESISLDDKETKLIEIRAYAERLKKQYKILGHPNLVLVHPDGSVIGQYRGYKRGEASFRWGQLKQGLSSFQVSYEAWRATMEKRGYRVWADRKGRTVFARLVRYHEGMLSLVEPDGTRSKTDEKRLCDGDRAWIAEQKLQRGL